MDFEKVLEEYLREREDTDAWDKSELHASDLGVALDGPDGRCARQLELRLKGAPAREPTAGMMMLWRHGRAIHEWLAEVYASVYEATVEHDLTDAFRAKGLEIVGTSDFVVKIKAAPLSPHVVDFKTVRGRAFQYLDKPKPANVLQLRAYMYALDADEGTLIYVDREGQNFIRAFRVEADHQQVEEAERYARQVRDHGGAKIEPKIKVFKNGKVKASLPWQCEYCEYYRHSCDGALDGLKVPKNTEIGRVKGGGVELHDDFRVSAHVKGRIARAAGMPVVDRSGGIYRHDEEVGF